MLAWEAGDAGGDCGCGWWRWGGLCLGGGRCEARWLWREGQIDVVPPVELGAVLNATGGEPFLVSERNKEMALGVSLCDFRDGRVGEMVVVVVADDDRVDKGYVFNLAWHLGVSFWPQPAEG